MGEGTIMSRISLAIVVGLVSYDFSVILAQDDCGVFQPVPGEGIVAELVVEGLASPIDLQSAPGDGDRIFVVEQGGRIMIVEIPQDLLVPEPFLDISGSGLEFGGEQGLLGLAFPPDHLENGFFYVNYTKRGGNTVVSRFSVSVGDPNVTNPESELVLLEISQPAGNHNGGALAFGPLDDYLYISTGDGGGGCDPEGHGQRGDSLLGKILRLDVDNLNLDGSQSVYSIPESNPFVDDPNVLDEIWALGLRNPWRMSFDTLTGDLYIGDVGQQEREEIDFQPGTSLGGENYEWVFKEGASSSTISGCFPGELGPSAELARGPILDYPHSRTAIYSGISVTGGVAYRGCRMPDLHGTYFFSDFGRSFIGAIRYEFDPSEPDRVVPEEDKQLRTAEVNAGISGNIGGISAFGRDSYGEIYIVSIRGSIFRIASSSAPIERPTAGFTIVPADGIAPVEVRVDGSLSTTIPGGALSEFRWDFGDGEAGIGETVVHEYDSFGVFTIDLTLIDDRNLSAKTSQDVMVRFPREDVSPWSSTDIGTPSFPGGARPEGPKGFQIGAGGSGAFGAEDELHFVSQPVSGDVTLTALVSASNPEDLPASFGVMLRSSLDPAAANVAMLFQQSSVLKGVVHSRRVADDASVRRSSVRRSSLPVWLRVGRRGSRFRLETSTDGESWVTRLTVSVDLPETLHAGVVAWSSRAIDLHVNSLQIEQPQFTRGDCNGDRLFDMADTLFGLDYLFEGGTTPACTESCDSNDDSLFDISDAIYSLLHLFADGPAPSAPFPECGVDPQPLSGFGCETLNCTAVVGG